jgi:hypothetical protein
MYQPGVESPRRVTLMPVERVSKNHATTTRRIAQAGIVLFLTFCAATPSPAQTRQNILKKAWHFAGHHKELLAADAVIFLSANAAAASTVHCIHDVSCGQRPVPFGTLETNAHAYAKANLIALGGAAIMNFGWHYRPKESGQTMAHIFLWSIPTLSVVGNGLQAHDEVTLSDKGKTK